MHSNCIVGLAKNIVIKRTFVNAATSFAIIVFQWPLISFAYLKDFCWQSYYFVLVFVGSSIYSGFITTVFYF
ncbi:hypothetical protein ACM9HF_02940 [Colwellia sp. RE-S-Sl-9]